MSTKNLLVVALMCLLLPAPLWAGTGNAFTVQALLRENGDTITGSVDVVGTLYDAAGGGNVIGAPVQVNNIAVSDGLLSWEFDFGPGTFDGGDRHLELAVRNPHDPTDTAPFTTLDQRIRITPAPEAIHAQTAGGVMVPLILSLNDANQATLTVENLDPDGVALAVQGDLTVGPQGEFQVEAETGSVVSQGTISANGLSAADDAFVGDDLTVVRSVLVNPTGLPPSLDLDDQSADFGVDLVTRVLLGQTFSVSHSTGDVQTIGNVTLTQGDIHVAGAYFDSLDSPGTPGLFLKSTGVGTVWDELIVGPLDLKNNALINIGTGGSSFGSNGGLNLTADLDMGSNAITNIGAGGSAFAPDGTLTVSGDLFAGPSGGATTVQVDSTNGQLIVGQNKAIIDAATGDALFDGDVQVNDDLRVGPNAEFFVNGLTGSATMDGDLSVRGAYFDTGISPGNAGQFLTSTGTGTQWRDLIVGDLDLKTFGITNIGSSGSFFFPDGSLTVGPTLTVRDAQGQSILSVSDAQTSSAVDFVVGAAEFSVDAETGNTLVFGDLFVEGQFKDSTGVGGAPNDILSSTGTGTQWINRREFVAGIVVPDENNPKFEVGPSGATDIQAPLTVTVTGTGGPGPTQDAVTGESQNGTGVFGKTDAGIGVYGNATGTGIGVQGEALGAGGTGVSGSALAGGGIAGNGLAAGADAVGVYGQVNDGRAGVRAEGFNGLAVEATAHGDFTAVKARVLNGQADTAAVEANILEGVAIKADGGRKALEAVNNNIVNETVTATNNGGGPVILFNSPTGRVGDMIGTQDGGVPLLLIQNDGSGHTVTVAGGDGLYVEKHYFDSIDFEGNPKDILTATATGTMWRRLTELITEDLDFQNFAITNIGSGGSSFGSDGSLILNADLFVGPQAGPTTVQVDTSNGQLIVGQNKVIIDAATGDLNIGSGLFTVNGSNGNVATQRDLSVAGDAHVNGSYFDSAGLPGDPNQILSSTGDGTLWVALPGQGGDASFNNITVGGTGSFGPAQDPTAQINGTTGEGIFEGPVEPQGGIRDAASSLGTAGQVLTSTGTGVLWQDCDCGGGGTSCITCNGSDANLDGTFTVSNTDSTKGAVTVIQGNFGSSTKAAIEVFNQDTGTFNNGVRAVTFGDAGAICGQGSGGGPGGDFFTFGTGNAAVEATNPSGHAIHANGDVDFTGNGFISGNFDVGGTLSKAGGSFKIDHPLDPENKYLYHSFVESPDMMNIYNGNVVTGADGYAIVALPDWFETLNRDFRYQLTIVDDQNSDSFVLAKVVQRVQANQFTLRTSEPFVEVSWQVTGIRHDPWADANRIPVEESKPETERGKYLHPAVYGEPEQRGLAYEGTLRMREAQSRAEQVRAAAAVTRGDGR